MDVEDDGPPMLISADGDADPQEAALTVEMEDVKITKVPITIITGRCIEPAFLCHFARVHLYPKICPRIIRLRNFRMENASIGLCIMFR